MGIMAGMSLMVAEVRLALFWGGAWLHDTGRSWAHPRWRMGTPS